MTGQIPPRPSAPPPRPTARPPGAAAAPAPAAPPRRRWAVSTWALVGLGAAAIVIVLVAMVQDGVAPDPLPDGASVQTVAHGAIDVDVPATWVTRTDGDTLVAASDVADLDADVPAGPRLRVRSPDPSGDPLVALEAVGTEDLPGTGTGVVGDPQSVTIAGLPAVRLLIRDGDRGIVQEHHVLVAPDGRTHVLTAETPIDAWPDDALGAAVAGLRVRGA